MNARLKTLIIEVAGWIILVAGIAALVLPGPGLLMVFAGMVLLAQRYAWAQRWLRPVELRAMYGAAKGVQTWPRIVTASVFALGIGATGILWLVHPPAPSWWPVSPDWWLFGGRVTGVTLLFSCAVALGLIGWSFRRFRGHPDLVAELQEEITATPWWHHVRGTEPPAEPPA